MVFDFIPSLVDPVFNNLLVFKPVVSLFIFSTILTAIIFFINKLLVNQKDVKRIKENLTNVKEKLSKAQKEGNKDDIKNLLNEMTTVNNEYFKQTFKMLIVSMVVLLVLFPWANTKFGDVTVVTHPFISFISILPLLNLIPNWLVWYILTSIGVSWLLRKFVGE